MSIKLVNADSLEFLKTLPDNCVDSVVCDPPYGLSQLKQKEFLKVLSEWASGNYNYTPKKKGFMGQTWDGFIPSPSLWIEVLRVLKPGGHALVFAGSRTQDLMGLSLRIAGFEIRDCIQWVYGSGFPKSHNIGKAVDKALGNEREVVGTKERGSVETTTKGTLKWEGWGTSLKPAYEPILLVRKPLNGTVVQNILEHGVGGINIDECRIGDIVQDTSKNGRSPDKHKSTVYESGLKENFEGQITVGRFPSNITFSPHDGEDCPVEVLDEQSPNASRFFYCAKASKSEKESNQVGKDSKRFNIHPTVKPIKLMQYLVRLITPKGGAVVDPFMGSGTTGIACVKEEFDFLGIELNKEYFEIAKLRIENAEKDEQ